MTENPTPDRTVRMPALLVERPAADGPVARTPAARPAKPHDAARRPEAVRDDPEEGLKDPYSGGDDLKDPFQ